MLHNKIIVPVTGYSRARSGITSATIAVPARAAYVNTQIIGLPDEKWNTNQLLSAKYKNEDSDLGWTADFKINLKYLQFRDRTDRLPHLSTYGDSSAMADAPSAARRASTSPVPPAQRDADRQTFGRRLLRQCGRGGNGRAGMCGQETLRHSHGPRGPGCPAHGGQVLPRVQPPLRAPPPAHRAVPGHLLPTRLKIACVGYGATAVQP